MSQYSVNTLFFDVLLDKFAACLRRMGIDRGKDEACRSMIEFANKQAEPRMNDPWSELHLGIRSFVTSMEEAIRCATEEGRRIHLANARYHLDLLRCWVKAFRA